MTINGLPNKYDLFRTYYLESKGVLISYQEAMEMFYQLEGADKTDFERYYYDETGYSIIAPSGYNLDFDSTSNSSHYLNLKYTLEAYAKERGATIDSIWAQYTWQEIIQMEEGGGVVIPDDVLAMAHAMQAEYEAGAAEGSEGTTEGENATGSEGNSSNVNKTLLELVPETKEKITSCLIRDDEISSLIDSLLPEKENHEKELKDKIKKQKSTLDEYESNVREWQSLKEKIDDGEVLTERENKRFSELSEILGAKKDESEGMKLNKNAIAKSLEEINILSILGEDLAEETIQIGEDLKESVSKTNYKKVAHTIHMSPIIFACSFLPMAKALGDAAVEKGQETLDYTQQSQGAAVDIASVLGIENSLSTVDENGNIVDPQEPIDSEEGAEGGEEENQTEEANQKSGFFYVTDSEVLGYIQEGRAINSELNAQIHTALKQIKVAKNDQKYVVLASTKVSKIVEDFFALEAEREKEREAETSEMEKSQQIIDENNKEIEKIDEELAEEKEKEDEMSEFADIAGVSEDEKSEDEEDGEDKNDKKKELEAKKKALMLENAVEQEKMLSNTTDLDKINLETEQHKEAVRSITEKEKQNIDTRIPQENDALEINNAFKGEDLPVHNERMDFIHNAGVNLMTIGANEVSLGTSFILTGQPLLLNLFTHMLGIYFISMGTVLVTKGTISIGIGATACVVSDDESRIDASTKATDLAGQEISTALSGLSELGAMISSVTGEVFPEEASAEGTENAEGGEGAEGEEGPEGAEGEDAADGTEGATAGAEATDTTGDTTTDPATGTTGVDDTVTVDATDDTTDDTDGTTDGAVGTVSTVGTTSTGAKMESAENETTEDDDAVEEVKKAEVVEDTGATEEADKAEEDKEAEDEEDEEGEEDDKDVKTAVKASNGGGKKDKEEISTDKAGEMAKEGEKVAKEDSKDSVKVRKDTEKDEKELEKETKQLMKTMQKDQKNIEKMTKQSLKAVQKQLEIYTEFEAISAESEQLIAEDEAKQNAQNGIQDTSVQTVMPANGMASTGMASNSMTVSTGSDAGSSNEDKLNQNDERLNTLGAEFKVQGNIVTRNSKKIKKLQKRTKTNEKKYIKKTKIRNEKIKEAEKKEQDKQKRLAKQLAAVGIAENVFTITLSIGTILAAIPWSAAVGNVMITIGNYGILACGLTKAAINLANGNWAAALIALGQAVISVAAGGAGISSGTSSVMSAVSAGLNVVASSAELVNNVRAVQGKEASGVASKISAIAGAASAVTNAAGALGKSGGGALTQIGKYGNLAASVLSSTSQLMTTFGKDGKAAEILGIIGTAVGMASSISSMLGAKMDAKKNNNDKKSDNNKKSDDDKKADGDKDDDKKADGDKDDDKKADESKPGKDSSKDGENTSRPEGGNGAKTPGGSSGNDNSSKPSSEGAKVKDGKVVDKYGNEVQLGADGKPKSTHDTTRQPQATTADPNNPAQNGNPAGNKPGELKNPDDIKLDIGKPPGMEPEKPEGPTLDIRKPQEMDKPPALEVQGGVKGLPIDKDQVKAFADSFPGPKKPSALSKAQPWMQLAGQAFGLATSIASMLNSEDETEDTTKKSLSPYQWSKRMRDIKKKRITALQGRNRTSNNSKRKYNKNNKRKFA